MLESEATLTAEQYDAFYTTLDNSRKNAKTVRVDKEALQALLNDHAKLWDSVS